MQPAIYLAGKLPPARRIQDINAPTLPIKRHVQHIAVQDTAGGLNGKKSLDAYMVPSQYLPRDVIKRVAPKRPLGQPLGQTIYPSRQEVPSSKPAAGPVAAAEKYSEPTHFYSHAPAMAEPLRIRRPRRNVPVITAAGQSISQTMPGAHRVHYSAAQGASQRRFGWASNRIKFGGALIIFLLLLSFGLFGGLLDYNSEAPRTTDTRTNGRGTGSTNGSNSGGSVLDVNNNPTDSSNGSSSPTTSPQPGAPSPGGRIAAGGPALQPSGPVTAPATTPIIVGGRGGAETGTGSGAPTVGTGSNTVPEALPTPPASGPVFENTPPTPLPITVTIPPVDMSAEGKTIVDTSGTTVTVN